MLSRTLRPVASQLPLRVALLTTSRAPGLSYLLEQDPERGRLYDIVAGIASDPESEALGQLRQAGIPALSHDLRAFCSARGGKWTDLALRRQYDTLTVRLLEAHRPGLIVLCGYLHIVTEPLLAAYPTALINVHDADLLVAGSEGGPRFRGLHSTYDALAEGRDETRSTVHLVAADVDAGPPLVRSWGFPSHPLVADARRWNAAKILKAYAFAQREWMMRSAWGPLLARALRRFALGQVRVLDGRAVIAGRLGPEELRRESPPVLRAAEA